MSRNQRAAASQAALSALAEEVPPLLNLDAPALPLLLHHLAHQPFHGSAMMTATRMNTAVIAESALFCVKNILAVTVIVKMT